MPSPASPRTSRRSWSCRRSAARAARALRNLDIAVLNAIRYIHDDNAASPRKAPIFRVNLQQHVLRDFLRVLAASGVPERELEDPLAVSGGKLINRRLIAFAHAGDEHPLDRRIRTMFSVHACRTPGLRGLFPLCLAGRRLNS